VTQGEHLELHVIATSNSPMRHLDPALLRPGRLMGAREFRRLTRPEAQRLAQAKGLALSDQEDFNLAELYCGAVSRPALNADRQIRVRPMKESSAAGESNLHPVGSPHHQERC
jgi:hypothetical protein